MKKNLLKVLLLTTVAIVAMMVVASANTATIEGTYSNGTVTITVSGVGATDEVSVLAVPADQDLSAIASSNNPIEIVKHVDQKTAAGGTVSFKFTSDTEEFDVYSGYSSMGVSDAVLLKEFRSSAGGEDPVVAPTVDAANSKLDKSAYTLPDFQRILIKLTGEAGQWMPKHSNADSAIFYSTESNNYEGLIKTAAADLTAALAEISWDKTAPTADQTIAKYGDMTGDGIINILDFAKVSALNKKTAQANYGDKKDYLTADADGDGILNVLDLAQLKKYTTANAKGESYTFPTIEK